MSRSRKPVARKPRDALSKENAKLTKEIKELEDGLLLHQRNIDEDHNSVPGLIRQEVGGSHWQYGGSGKLYTFRSKNDLQEVQEAGNGRGKKSNPAEKSKKQQDQLKVVLPRCLNEDSDIGSKNASSRGESRKGSAKSSHSKSKSTYQASWKSGTRNLEPSSKEYDAFMQGIFGEGGFPLENQYSVESATVGMSLFTEKDQTDLTEMKSKVLKRASAVLIMRPRSAPNTQGKHSAQERNSATLRNSKVTKTKDPKKLTGAPTDQKSVTVIGSRRDVHAEQDSNKRGSLDRNTSHSPSPHSARKSSGDYPIFSSPARHSTCLETSSAKTLRAALSEEDVSSEKNEKQHKGDAQNVNEDMSEVLALISKPRQPESKPDQEVLISEQRYPVLPRTWDRNAVPKPWDNWIKTNSLDQRSSRKPIAKKSDSLKVKSFESFHQDVLNSCKRPPMGKSWTALGATRRPSSANHLSHRHSWTGNPTSKAPNSKPTSRKGSVEGLELLSSSKQKAVADWLEKHVSQSQEEAAGGMSKPSSGSSSFSNTGTSTETVLGPHSSSNTLEDITAHAGGVGLFERHKQIGAWLCSLGLKEVDKYEKLFKQHQIEMVDLPSLTVPILEHMGISKLGPIMKIMRGLEQLKAQVSKVTEQLMQRKKSFPETTLGDDFFKMPDSTGKTEIDETAAAKPVETDTDNSKLDNSEPDNTEPDNTKPDNSKPDNSEPDNSKPESTESKSAESKLCDSTFPDESESVQEAKPLSPSGRLQSFRQSLQELYSSIFGGNMVAETSEDTITTESSQAECTTSTQYESGLSSETSSNIISVNGMTDTRKADTLNSGAKNDPAIHLKHLNRNTGKAQSSSDEANRLSSVHSEYMSKTDTMAGAEIEGAQMVNVPQSRSGKASCQSGSSDSITMVMGKVKGHSASGKVKGQGDGMQQNESSYKTAPGQGTGLAASVERMVKRLAERQRKRQEEEEMMEQRLQRLRDQRYAMAARHKRHARSSSVEGDSLQLDELTAWKERRRSDSGLEDSFGHYFDSTGEEVASFPDACAGAMPSSEVTAFQFEEMCHLLEKGSDGRHLQGMTLSKVHQLQNTLLNLEKSLMLSETTTPASPTTSTSVFPHSSTGKKSRHMPASRQKPSPYGRSIVMTESGGRHCRRKPVTGDFNENATTTAAPPLIMGPRVITLTFKDIMLGKGGGENHSSLQKEEEVEVSGTRRQATAVETAPGLSMSKRRQLLDEIHKEKDKHRKNVRHLKSELTRLKHKDPVTRSELDRADIEFKESDLIGEGSFCQVFRGQYQGAEVAVKRLKTPLSPLDNNYFAAEVSLLHDLRHPRVVLLVGVSTADHLPIMVLEYMAGRDLYSLIHHPSGEGLDHAEFYQIARDMSSGMVYLHHHRPPVLHLDLKSMNILLTSAHRAKIADFGFSKLKHDADRKGGKSIRNKEVKGSPAWMAPELIQGGDITPKADVYSFAIILWEMTSRQHPYQNCSVYEILERVRLDRRPEIPESCPHDLSVLITRCWNPNPAARPNFKEVLKQVEELSFPPGWRALFKAAGVPSEALEDVTSTRHIISLVSSSLESPALLTAAASIAAKSGPDNKGIMGRSSKKEGSNSNNPLVRDSLETCDYSLSGDEDDSSLHLDDSLDTTLRSYDSLEQVSSCSSPYNTSNDTQKKPSSRSSCGSASADGQRHTQTGVNQPAGVGGVSVVKVYEVPMLSLDSLRSPTPQAMHWSVSTLYDSVEDGLQHPGPGTKSSTRVSGSTLTPIIPRLALEELGSEEVAVVPLNMEATKVQPVPDPLSRHPPLTPKTSQPMTGEEGGDGKDCLALSARQTRRLGLSRKLPFCDLHTSSPRESSSSDDPLHTETVSATKNTSSSENGEETLNVCDSPAEEQTSQRNLQSCLDNIPPGRQSESNKSVSEKPVPYTPKSKERTKLSARYKKSPVPEKPEVNSQTKFESSREKEKEAAERSPLKNNPDPSSTKTTLRMGQDRSPPTLTPAPTTTMLTSPSVLLPPPPPPHQLPPPPPLFTPSLPYFSSSSKPSSLAVLKGETDQRATMLASIHQELMAQVTRHDQPDSARASKKKRNFLKERYHGNPHISVEASALVEQRSQLRSVTQPHPSQLRDLPCSGQVFTSMTDLLRKAMEDRRFAMGENQTASTSHSQEMTEVSWSLQDT